MKEQISCPEVRKFSPEAPGWQPLISHWSSCGSLSDLTTFSGSIWPIKIFPVWEIGSPSPKHQSDNIKQTRELSGFMTSRYLGLRAEGQWKILSELNKERKVSLQSPTRVLHYPHWKKQVQSLGTQKRIKEDKQRKSQNPAEQAPKTSSFLGARASWHSFSYVILLWSNSFTTEEIQAAWAPNALPYLDPHYSCTCSNQHLFPLTHGWTYHTTFLYYSRLVFISPTSWSTSSNHIRKQ